jgi:hypothetical protein
MMSSAYPSGMTSAVRLKPNAENQQTTKRLGGSKVLELQLGIELLSSLRNFDPSVERPVEQARHPMSINGDVVLR